MFKDFKKKILLPCFLFVLLFALAAHAGELPEMVFVKGGCFQMGDMFGDGNANERPVHEVCVDDFYIGRYEVTQGQWKKIMGYNPSHYKRGNDYPVESVSWDDAQRFLKKLSRKTGKRYRLPTEAEWEYAARSRGKKQKWAGTSKKSELEEYAWYKKNSGRKTHPVGQKKPNSLGLYDMAGNVWEWVADWRDTDIKYVSEYYKNSPQNNPKGPLMGEIRIVRGGSWKNPKDLRVSARHGGYPHYRLSYIGFRCARTP